MSVTEREQKEVERANASGRKPVVFVHGLWLLAESWDPWRALFEDAGFTALAPGWPDDPSSPEAARKTPDVLAGKGVTQVTDHFDDVVSRLKQRPVIIGHSFGGLITQKLAGRGRAAVSVAIDPAPFKGVLPLPFTALKAAAPVLTQPANYMRAVMLTFEQFRYAFANSVSEAEGRELYEKHVVPAPGRPLFQAATANLHPWAETKVDTRTPRRGPLLIISGKNDNIVPWAMASAAYKLQKRNAAATEIRELPNRGHSLIIDSGWQEVAQVCLDFVRQHIDVGTKAGRAEAGEQPERRV
jgi:pimeloyl-ACP methyl ester carboxylesterase